MERRLRCSEEKSDQITVDFMQLRVILNANAERRAPLFAPPRV